MDQLPSLNPKEKRELKVLTPLCNQFSQFQSLPITSIADVVANKGASISTLSRHYQGSDVKAFIVLQLGTISKMFNVGKTLSDWQVVSIAEMIIQRKGHLKLTDLKLCFENAAAGKYGINYDRIDSAVMFEWIEKYEWDKAEYMADRNAHKENSAYAGMAPAIWLKFKTEPPEKKPEPVRNISPETKIAQQIMREFDDIWTKYPLKHDGRPMSPRMIEHLGKKLTCEDYLIERMAEINDVRTEQ